MKKTDKTMITRMEELEEEARNRFLEHSDYDYVDWMKEEERDEYALLYKKKYGQCVFCGEKECECDRKGE